MQATFVPRDPPIVDPPIRIAVCASGGGTTLQNLIDRIGDRTLRASIVRVIASKAGIGAIAKAQAAAIPVLISSRTKGDAEAYSRTVFDSIREAGADLVVLAGFLALLEIPNDYVNKMINIHPSLIPSFCGQGFHGLAVHRAVLERGVKVTGCTVHFVDQTYDTGPIILQKTVLVEDDDTPERLAARVFDVECQALPEAIRLYSEARLGINRRRVVRMEKSEKSASMESH